MKLVIATLILLVLSGAALELAPMPFLWISALGFACCAVAAWRARSNAARMAAVYGAVVVGVLGGFEAWLWTGAGTPPDVEFSGGYKDAGYFVEHPVLGYGARPGLTADSTKRVNGEQVYSVTYGIDEHGLRRVPAPAIPDPLASVAFFGCSVTFGEGLDDEQTLPALVARAVADRYRVYNFGFHGYGPHQMLAALESDFASGIVREPPVLVVYQALGHHVERSAGRVDWDHQGPRYALRPDGTVERVGRFGDRASALGQALHERLERVRLYRQTIGSERALREADVALAAGIVRTARDRIRSAYPEADFEVLLWGRRGEGRAEKFGAALAAAGLQVHWVRDVIPDYDEHPERYQLSRHDQHPNAAAQQALARYVVGTLLPRANAAAAARAEPPRSE